MVWTSDSTVILELVRVSAGALLFIDGVSASFSGAVFVGQAARLKVSRAKSGVVRFIQLSSCAVVTVGAANKKGAISASKELSSLFSN